MNIKKFFGKVVHQYVQPRCRLHHSGVCQGSRGAFPLAIHNPLIGLTHTTNSTPLNTSVMKFGNAIQFGVNTKLQNL